MSAGCVNSAQRVSHKKGDFRANSARASEPPDRRPLPKWPSFRVGDAFCRKLGLFAWIDIRERLAVGIADFKATGYHALPLPNVTQGLSGARNGLSSFPNLELNEDMLDVRFDGLGCDGKNSCDFLVRSTLGDQIEDVSLANTEWLCNRGNCRGQRRFKIYKATGTRVRATTPCYCGRFQKRIRCGCHFEAPKLAPMMTAGNFQLLV